MVNNGVHWMSDYPLALGIGYVVGKFAVSSGRKKVGESSETSGNRIRLIPTFIALKTVNITLLYSF